MSDTLPDPLDDTPASDYWGHLENDELAAAIIDRFDRFRQWQQQSGLTQGWRLKLNYYYNTYRANPTIPHLSVMEKWGAQGEYSFISVNHLRSLLKTVLASVVQNPPAFQPTAVNADADAGEAASLYQGVLDYYTRELRLNAKLNKAVETGLVVDQGFLLIEWDNFASSGDTPDPATIWKGAPSVKVLYPWDICWDVSKAAWTDQDYIIVRDWQDKEKVRAQYPEMSDDISACRLRGEVEMSSTEVQSTTRYEMTGFEDMSNDIQIFKLFFRPTPYMPNGRYVMALENGKMLWESPIGLLYPTLPVERFVCDEQVDLLLGYSPINDLLAPQEAINSLVSAITTNTNNFANQMIAVEAGTELNPRSLGEGSRVVEYPPGSKPPVGINFTAIPEPLFSHLNTLMKMMQEVPSVSNASRGQAPGANSSGSAMLLLDSQTSANQGSMSEHYAEFCAGTMTSLLHMIRLFGRTQKTINIMGKTVASKTIVLAEALKDFDEVVVTMSNPILNTPSGKMQFAQQIMQWGGASPAQALAVATTGNLGAVVDPIKEVAYELAKENEWLLEAQDVAVLNTDDHAAHIAAHSRLLATPWIRNAGIAQKLNIQNAPQIQQTIQNHIVQHMQMMQAHAGVQGTIAGAAPPGAAQPPQHAPVMTGAKGPPAPSGDAPADAPAQGGAAMAHTSLPSPPAPATMPK